MTVTSDVVFLDGLDFFTRVVEQVDPGGWEAASPCAGWTALDVLGHLGSAIRFGAAALRGETYQWPTVDRPAELVQSDPAAYWADTAAAARQSLQGADLDLVMDTPMGPRSVRDRLAFPAIDLFVHAWDIARAVGIEVGIPVPVMEFAHSYIDPLPQEMVRGQSGAFGPELRVGPDASPTTVFIAWTGRTPR